MLDNILFVDDEPNVVLAFKVSLKGRFHVETATNGSRTVATMLSAYSRASTTWG